MRGIRKQSRNAEPVVSAELLAERRLVLHVGCGPPGPERLHARFRGPEWHELRFDIDRSVRPDIVGTIVDMAGVRSASVDLVWSSHNIEHVTSHEVGLVFREFLRVLRPGGELLLTTPDLQRVAERIVAGVLDEPIYTSPSGAISPLDMVYGYTAAIADGNDFMAHKTGFTAASLTTKLRAAGFLTVRVERTRDDHALWATGWRPATVV
jgi:SAM-dependent methyltransferase